MPSESVLLVPVHGLPPLIEELRRQHDPSARAGVPAHITVLYPFVEPQRLTVDTFSELDRLLNRWAACDYALTEVREFEKGVLYLAPEPAKPFIELTTMVGDRFDLLPFGGTFPTVVPHLTVMQSADEADRERITSLLRRALPQSARASEAWVMVGDNDSDWTTVHTTKFR